MKNIVKRAKEYIDCMKSSDSTSQHHRLIVDLLQEVKDLKIQVNDRGNSFQKATEKNKQLRATLKEVSGCHDNHNTPKLCEGCLISIGDALAE